MSLIALYHNKYLIKYKFLKWIMVNEAPIKRDSNGSNGGYSEVILKIKYFQQIKNKTYFTTTDMTLWWDFHFSMYLYIKRLKYLRFIEKYFICKLVRKSEKNIINNIKL